MSECNTFLLELEELEVVEDALLSSYHISDGTNSKPWSKGRGRPLKVWRNVQEIQYDIMSQS